MMMTMMVLVTATATKKEYYKVVPHSWCVLTFRHFLLQSHKEAVDLGVTLPWSAGAAVRAERRPIPCAGCTRTWHSVSLVCCRPTIHLTLTWPWPDLDVNTDRLPINVLGIDLTLVVWPKLPWWWPCWQWPWGVKGQWPWPWEIRVSDLDLGVRTRGRPRSKEGAPQVPCVAPCM